MICEDIEPCAATATHRALVNATPIYVCDEHAFAGDIPLHHLTPTRKATQ